MDLLATYRTCQAAPRAAARRIEGAWARVAQKFGPLCLARYQPSSAARERAIVIARRTRLIAAIFAGLTIAWIGIDALTLSWPLWGQVAIGRVIAGLAFGVLAIHPVAPWPGLSPGRDLGFLIAVPIAFFFYACFLINRGGTEDSLTVGATYHYLPFIVAAGLGIFPLTALESALLGGACVLAMASAMLVWPDMPAAEPGASTLWRLVLIAGIAGIAGMSQLRFLLRLTEQATRDGLTGLIVRRVGEELLESQFAFAQRHDRPLTLLFIDLDRFKLINDQFGHDAGDRVLAKVGESLLRTFRRQDVAIRWGGEEFVIGLPDTDAKNAEAMLRRLEALGLGDRPDGSTLTASIGVAERQADCIGTLRALAELADRRMYQAKQAGRNRFVFRDGPQPWLGQAKQAA